MNTLLEVSARMPYHTDVRRVFIALDGRQREFNWLLTDLELNHYPPGLPYLADRQLARWVSGAALSAIVDAHDVQFIWGVLSGFRPGVTPDLTPLDPYPFADGNEALASGSADPASARRRGDRLLGQQRDDPSQP